jgi:hypothetical protein
VYKNQRKETDIKEVYPRKCTKKNEVVFNNKINKKEYVMKINKIIGLSLMALGVVSSVKAEDLSSKNHMITFTNKTNKEFQRVNIQVEFDKEGGHDYTGYLDIRNLGAGKSATVDVLGASDLMCIFPRKGEDAQKRCGVSLLSKRFGNNKDLVQSMYVRRVLAGETQDPHTAKKDWVSSKNPNGVKYTHYEIVGEGDRYHIEAVMQ